MTKPVTRKLPSTARGRRRMLTLATLLEADAKNKYGLKFDLGTWGDGVDRNHMGLDCGTRACAMGLAALSGKFKRAGLRYKIRDNSDFFGDSTNLVVMLGNRRGFSAAQKLFDLSEDEAEWLFSKNYYTLEQGKGAERAVAKRLRRFAAGRQKVNFAVMH